MRNLSHRSSSRRLSHSSNGGGGKVLGLMACCACTSDLSDLLLTSDTTIGANEPAAPAKDASFVGDAGEAPSQIDSSVPPSDNPSDLADTGGPVAPDAASPAAGLVSPLLLSSPLPKEVAVDPTTDIELTFDREIEVGTGLVRVLRSADDTLFESISVNDERRATLTNRTLSIDLDGILGAQTSYYIRVDRDAVILKTSGQSWQGLNDTSLHFETAPAAGPGPLVSGLVQWLDAKYVLSLKDEARKLSVWGDRSGLNHSAIQLDEVQQPQTRQRPLNESNAVSFEGAQVLRVANSSLLNDAQQWTIYAVVLSDTNDGHVWSRRADATDPAPSVSLKVAGSNVVADLISDSTFTAAADGHLAQVPLIIEASWAFEGPLTVRRNAGRVATSPSPLPTGALPSDLPVAIGADPMGGNGWNGLIGELVVYNRVHTPEESRNLREYLEDKWSIDATQPLLETSSPADDQTLVDSNPGISLVFSEAVRIGLGSATIHLLSDERIVDTITLTNNDQVQVMGNSVQFPVSAPLTADTEYFLRLEAGAITDLAMHPFDGIEDKTRLNFKTAP